MLSAIALTAALAASACSPVVRPPAPKPSSGGAAVFSRDEAVNDERTLMHEVESAHPNVFSARTRQSIEADVRAIERRFGPRVTRVELFRDLAPLVGTFGDGHTYIDPYIPEYSRSGGTRFPLELDCLGASVFVVADLAQHPEVPPGAVLESIGGTDAVRAIDRVGRYNAGDSTESRRFDTCAHIREFIFLGGTQPPYALTYRMPGSRRKRHALRSGTTPDRVRRWGSTPAAQNYRGDPSIRFEDGGAIAVLTMHSFDPGPDLTRFLNAAFRRLRDRRTRALLIDLRENGGGDLSVGPMLMDRITTRPYRLVARSYTKVSDVVRRALGSSEYQRLYGDVAARSADGTLVETRFEPQPPEPVPDRFLGRTYVLVGSGTFSSAAMFAAGVQDAHVGMILGHPSGGNASNYGERFEFTLPASGLTVSVATKRFIRSNGEVRPGPVVPDKLFDETPPLDRDDEMRSAIDFVRRRLR
jgi:peptidase S41-like protein